MNNCKDSKNNLPFNSFVHFRRLKELIKSLAKLENVRLDEFDLSSITCYKAIGNNMKSPNVTTNTKDGSAIFVSDNRYYIAEIPARKNKLGSTNGKFLFLAYNKTYDYSMFGFMYVGRTNENSSFYTEKVRYVPKGVYKISYLEQGNNIRKVLNGRDITYGADSYKYEIFDFFESRKNAYKRSLADLTARKNGSNHSKNKIFSKTAVEKYKKNNQKRFKK